MSDDGGFSWGTTGAILSIPLAVLTVLILFLYYCWLHDVFKISLGKFGKNKKKELRSNQVSFVFEQPKNKRRVEQVSAVSAVSAKRRDSLEINVEAASSSCPDDAQHFAQLNITKRVDLEKGDTSQSSSSSDDTTKAQQHSTGPVKHKHRHKIHRNSSKQRKTKGGPEKPAKSDVVRAFSKRVSESQGELAISTRTSEPSRSAAAECLTGIETSELSMSTLPNDNPRTSEVTYEEIKQLSAEIHQSLQCPITVTSTSADPVVEQMRSAQRKRRRQKWTAPSRTNNVEPVTRPPSNHGNRGRNPLTPPYKLDYKVGRCMKAVPAKKSTSRTAGSPYSQPVEVRSRYKMVPFIQEILNQHNSSTKEPQSLYKVLVAMRSREDIGVNYKRKDSRPKQQPQQPSEPTLVTPPAHSNATTSAPLQTGQTALPPQNLSSEGPTLTVTPRGPADATSVDPQMTSSTSNGPMTSSVDPTQADEEFIKNTRTLHTGTAEDTDNIATLNISSLYGNMKALDPADELQIDILNRVFGMTQPLETPSLNLAPSDTQNPYFVTPVEAASSQTEVTASSSKDEHSFQNSKNQELLKECELGSSDVSVTSSSYYVTDIDGHQAGEVEVDAALKVEAEEKQTFITSNDETLASSSVTITKPVENQPSDQRPSVDYKKLFPSDPLYASSSLDSTSLPTLSSSQTSLTSSISSTSSVEGVGNLRFFS